MNKLKLSIIIVNYNGMGFIGVCLRSIKNFLIKDSYEVIVVDNSSDDGSPEFIRENFSWVKLIENDKNEGFGAANNQGARRAAGQYRLFLNSDTELFDGSLNEMVEFMERHPEIGVGCPSLVLEDKKTVQEGMSGNEPTLGRLVRRNKQVKIKWQNTGGDKYGVVDWVTGAAMMIKSDLFEKIGGFDERFFMYFEDVDLCRRVRAAGKKVAWYPGVKLIHFGGKSFAISRQKKTIYYQNQERYFAKYAGPGRVGVLKILRWPYRMIRGAK